MYNPSRGGVRGGADQFTWESVKSDKHRENYLGHSLKAPVGRWQKGKDLSWYAKERKDADGSVISETSELAAIKRAEEEAMLIALGHNIVRKETQMLSKEEVKEALKRNIGQRDELNIERIDGVGVTSRRAAMMSGSTKDNRSKNEGVMFESHQENSNKESYESPYAVQSKRKKSKKSSKKHKKEKKKHSRPSTDNERSEDDVKQKAQYKKHSKRDRSYLSAISSEQRTMKKRKHKQKNNSSDSESFNLSRSRLSSDKKNKNRTGSSGPAKRQRHDTSESD